MGLEPGNAGSYVQDSAHVENHPAGAPSMKVEVIKADSPTPLKDFVVWTERRFPCAKLDGDGVIFAGFGSSLPSITGMTLRASM